MKPGVSKLVQERGQDPCTSSTLVGGLLGPQMLCTLALHSGTPQNFRVLNFRGKDTGAFVLKKSAETFYPEHFSHPAKIHYFIEGDKDRNPTRMREWRRDCWNQLLSFKSLIVHPQKISVSIKIHSLSILNECSWRYVVTEWSDTW